MKGITKPKVKSKLRQTEEEEFEQIPHLVVIGESEESQKPEEAESQKSGVLQDLPEDVADYIRKRVKQTKQPATEEQSLQGMAQQAGAEESLEQLTQSIEEYITQGKGMEESSGDSEENEQESEQAPDEPKQPQDEAEQPEGGSSCTETERAFLDAFIKVQLAGRYLDMVTTGNRVEGTHVFNTRMFPVIDEVTESDKAFQAEIQLRKELFEMFAEPVSDLLELSTKLVDEAVEKDLEKQSDF